MTSRSLWAALVSFINSIRAQEPGYKEPKHDDFLKKVRVVLGDGAPNFRVFYSSPTGQKTMYRFPKREAALIAMSYSRAGMFGLGIDGRKFSLVTSS